MVERIRFFIPFGKSSHLLKNLQWPYLQELWTPRFFRGHQATWRHVSLEITIGRPVWDVVINIFNDTFLPNLHLTRRLQSHLAESKTKPWSIKAYYYLILSTVCIDIWFCRFAQYMDNFLYIPVWWGALVSIDKIACVLLSDHSGYNDCFFGVTLSKNKTGIVLSEKKGWKCLNIICLFLLLKQADHSTTGC